MASTDAKALATGELREPLSPWRILRQPSWLIRDLAPMPQELRRPTDYLSGVLLWGKVRQSGYTMLGCRRSRTLHRLARTVERAGVRGAIVDCGVWNGGSTAIMAAGAPTRIAWAFDSFEGLPAPGSEDDSAEGWTGSCLGTENNVHEAFRRFAKPSQLRTVKGWFDETLAKTASDVGPVALLHADGDWYDSVKLTLEVFYDQITSGGWVVVDDYANWSGARIAVNEFRSSRSITTRLMFAEGSAYWQRS